MIGKGENMNRRIGIIGGTGIYRLNGIENLHEERVETPFGSVRLNAGCLGGKEVAFLTRHGEHHSIAPNQINYRANLYALKEFGVKTVFATACSGSLNPDYQVGSFVLLEQFLDFTKNRTATFFENSADKPISHLDFTEPYCGTLGDAVVKAAESVGENVLRGATYCCMEGPRFETAAEVSMLKMLGGDLVGHTGYPEVVLAREAGMCYCSIGIVSNMAAGIINQSINPKEATDIVSGCLEILQTILSETIKSMPSEFDCACQHAVESAYM